MSTKKQATIAACQYTANLDDTGYRVIQCVAPLGYYWIESDSYHIAVTYGYGSNKSDAYRECIERMQCGIRPILDSERNESEYDGPAMPDWHI